MGQSSCQNGFLALRGQFVTNVKITVFTTVVGFVRIRIPALQVEQICSTTLIRL